MAVNKTENEGQNLYKILENGHMTDYAEIFDQR